MHITTVYPYEKATELISIMYILSLANIMKSSYKYINIIAVLEIVNRNCQDIFVRLTIVCTFLPQTCQDIQRRELTGISRAHNSPPNLQLSCIATLVVTLIIAFFLVSVRATMT